MLKNSAVKVTFWGVRGSYPQCQPTFAKVGGHTSCVSLEAAGHYLIFDAGTGLVDVGDQLLKQGLNKATLFISHAHADHISGLAFFKPLHEPDFHLTVVSCGLPSIEAVLAKVIAPPYFPIPLGQTSCQKAFIDLPIGGQFLLGPLKISTIALDHPGGSVGYRVDTGDKSICYMTDTSHTPGELNQSFVEFVRHTDLLIYDATFTEEEFAAKPTWGHSTWNQATTLAKAADIHDLALFHHNPTHNDAMMADIESQAQGQFSRAFVACQGMTWEA